MERKRISFLLCCASLALLLGCAGSSRRYDAFASERGLELNSVHAAGFELALYSRRLDSAGRRLHVYLEGDGRPLTSGWPSRDPTPESPVALELMHTDRGPSLLLGRPCYHGRRSETCTPHLWTRGRYAPVLVNAMAEALRTFEARELVLIGHSGGGSLAMLLAPYDPRVVAVVTLGANLDLAAWTTHHGDDALVGSLDPALQPPLAPHILQIHLAGAVDRQVPPAITRAVAGDKLRLLPDADHRCCWRSMWPGLLRELEEQLGPR